jgi:hypothetical protein
MVDELDRPAVRCQLLGNLAEAAVSPIDNSRSGHSWLFLQGA